MKVIKAIQYPAIPADDDTPAIPSTVTVIVRLDDGRECPVGGIDPKWARAEVDAYIDSLKNKIREIACLPEDAMERLDLVDDEFQPKEFTPLPGTGVPEKIEHIENFLAEKFPTGGV